MTEWSPENDLDGAERRAGVEVRTLSDLSDLDDARRVFDAVWPSVAGATQIQSNLLRALVHAGGYASAAYAEGEPVGAALGFVGRSARSERSEPRSGGPGNAGGGWHTHLHSHMAAVLAPFRDRHIGTALKMHQRVWALSHGLDTVVWTFDPLVRRNAALNLLKLGVDVDGYEVNFYGDMDDEINAGDPSDRMFAWWRLNSERAIAASMGRLAPADTAQLMASGRDVIEIPLPEDIVALRLGDPAAAARWRLALRESVLAALAVGYRIVTVSTDGGYVLERKSA